MKARLKCLKDRAHNYIVYKSNYNVLIVKKIVQSSTKINTGEIVGVIRSPSYRGMKVTN